MTNHLLFNHLTNSSSALQFIQHHYNVYTLNLKIVSLPEETISRQYF
jgi:hypothetical protein